MQSLIPELTKEVSFFDFLMHTGMLIACMLGLAVTIGCSLFYFFRYKHKPYFERDTPIYVCVYIMVGMLIPLLYLSIFIGCVMTGVVPTPVHYTNVKEFTDVIAQCEGNENGVCIIPVSVLNGRLQSTVVGDKTPLMHLGDGIEFRIVDYKGKKVFLKFSGNPNVYRADISILLEVVGDMPKSKANELAIMTGTKDSALSFQNP